MKSTMSIDVKGDSSGLLDRSSFSAFASARKGRNAHTEQEKPSFKVSDILCGRGGLANNHSGNRVFRRLVAHSKLAYQESENKKAKKKYVESIVVAVKRSGGRFLKQNGSDWCELSYEEALAKTSQAIREPGTIGKKIREFNRSLSFGQSSSQPVAAEAPSSSSDNVSFDQDLQDADMNAINFMLERLPHNVTDDEDSSHISSTSHSHSHPGFSAPDMQDLDLEGDDSVLDDVEGGTFAI